MNASSISSSDNQVWRATSLLSVLHGQITHSNELTIGTIGAYHACEWVMAQMCTSQSTNNNKSDLRYPPRSRLCASDRDRTWALMHLRRLLQPDPESSVLSMNVWKLNTQGKSKNVLIYQSLLLEDFKLCSLSSQWISFYWLINQHHRTHNSFESLKWSFGEGPGTWYP